MLTLPGGKYRALDNSVPSQELQWPSIEKVSLKLSIETTSKSGAILKKAKSKPKRKGKKKELAIANPDAWFIEGRGQIEVEHLVQQGGHGDFLVCRRFGKLSLLVNDGGTIAHYNLNFATDGSGSLVFGLARYRDVPSFIEHMRRTPFRANHVDEMVVLVRAAPGGILATPAQYSAPQFSQQSAAAGAASAAAADGGAPPLQRSTSDNGTANTTRPLPNPLPRSASDDSTALPAMPQLNRRKSLSLEGGLDLIADNASRLQRIAAGAAAGGGGSDDRGDNPPDGDLESGEDAFYQQQIEAQMLRLKKLQETKSSFKDGQRHGGGGSSQQMHLAAAAGRTDNSVTRTTLSGRTDQHAVRRSESERAPAPDDALYMNTSQVHSALGGGGSSRGSSVKSTNSTRSSASASADRAGWSGSRGGVVGGGGGGGLLRESTESGNIYMNAGNAVGLGLVSASQSAKETLPTENLLEDTNELLRPPSSTPLLLRGRGGSAIH